MAVIPYTGFLIDEDPVEITAGEGMVKARFNQRTIYEEKYVVGDYDDKLACTVRAYKCLVTALLLDMKPPAKKTPASPSLAKGPSLLEQILPKAEEDEEAE